MNTKARLYFAARAALLVALVLLPADVGARVWCSLMAAIVYADYIVSEAAKASTDEVADRRLWAASGIRGAAVVLAIVAAWASR